jgi:hypothetical protein
MCFVVSANQSSLVESARRKNGSTGHVNITTFDRTKPRIVQKGQQKTRATSQLLLLTCCLQYTVPWAQGLGEILDHPAWQFALAAGFSAANSLLPDNSCQQHGVPGCGTE